ncbi:hypothetical protein GXP67_08485 [Rhodocytophaga rosea]|uniref:Lipoprotein n=1 Tax=Rhodocytophaga rosea TaxID=2704465 RepID=A0A6C0GG21_9BACT|nr:hypothetical protein [Rhodocytophaga rosea]QHT66692.1 hypothetical protein GXP67_08485 [Rhodocytophaga rosea]
MNIVKWKLSCMLIGFIGSVLFSCGQEPASLKRDTRFFDLAAFIETQSILLDSLQPKVRKKVTIGDTVEEKIVSETNWAKELELFDQADISKPALQTSYEIEEQSEQIRVYKAKANENPNVKYIKTTLDSKTGQIVSLEALISRNNYLYHSEKKIWLQCRISPQGKSQISAYRISGMQKLIFNDQVPYHIEAEIL